MEVTPNVGADPVVTDTAPVETVDNNIVDTVENAESPKAEETKKVYTDEDIQRYEKALQKEQKRINKLTAAKYEAISQNKMLQERLAKLEQSLNVNSSGKPNADQFQSYDEYNEAVTDWKLEQKLKELNPEKESNDPYRDVPKHELEWAKSMESNVANQASQLAQHIPDFVEAMREYEPIFDAMPYELEKAFWQSQHPVLAAYVLAKEGKLEELLDMTPQQAAYEIGRATHVGVANINQYTTKPKTAAPKPMAAPSKGASSGQKPLNKQSWSELKKSLEL